MNEIIKATEHSLATIANDIDPYDAFADAVAPQHILGKLLKFSKGDWLAGENSEPVQLATTFVAGMHTMMTGWVCWKNFKPVDHIMISVGSRLLPPRRPMLGDNDPSEWETDDRGQKKDPWQLTSYLPLVASGDLGVFTFTGTSKGALDTLGKLSRAYAARRRRHPDELPIVTLGVSGYQHPRRELGYIKVPTFTVTGWEKAERFNEAMALAGYTAPDTEPEAKPDTNNDMNDDIPF